MLTAATANIISPHYSSQSRLSMVITDNPFLLRRLRRVRTNRNLCADDAACSALYGGRMESKRTWAIASE